MSGDDILEKATASFIFKYTLRSYIHILCIKDYRDHAKKSEDQIEINNCFLSLALIADFINDMMLTLLAFMHWVISLNFDGNEFLKNHKNCV